MDNVINAVLRLNLTLAETRILLLLGQRSATYTDMRTSINMFDQSTSRGIKLLLASKLIVKQGRVYSLNYEMFL